MLIIYSTCCIVQVLQRSGNVFALYRSGFAAIQAVSLRFCYDPGGSDGVFSVPTGSAGASGGLQRPFEGFYAPASGRGL